MLHAWDRTEKCTKFLVEKPEDQIIDVRMGSE
jgi:hypothetical protein